VAGSLLGEQRATLVTLRLSAASVHSLGIGCFLRVKSFAGTGLQGGITPISRTPEAAAAHAARDHMLNGGLDAASAAFEVGDESPSQFSREYQRFFGQPPIRDIKARRFPESTTIRD